jgi:DNA primase large subunit
MQAVTSSAGARKSIQVINSRRFLASFYIEPPQEELTLDEFELLSLDRLQLLRSIEVLKTRGFEDKELYLKIAQQEKKIAMARKEMTASSMRDGREMNDIKRDQISHFILRLAYCRTEDLRRWFLTQECILFKYRLDDMTDSERESFMSDNGLHFDMVSAEEKRKRMDKLIGLAGITNEVMFHNTNYYR